MSTQMNPLQTCEWRCAACRAIPQGNWDKWLGPNEWEVIDHHEDIHALGKAAGMGCYLCRIFWWSFFYYQDASAPHDAHEVPRGKCSVRFMRVPTYVVGEHIMIFFRVGDKGERQVSLDAQRGSMMGSSSWYPYGISATTSGGDQDPPSAKSMLPPILLMDVVESQLT